MELKRVQKVEAPHLRVWEALNDIEILKASIPGCESLERIDDDTLHAAVKIKIGPIAAKFKGVIKFSDLNPPNSYMLAFEGQGGAAGFAKGNARVDLTPEGPNATALSYETSAQVGGKIAQLGSRLIDSAAMKTATEFFENFSRALVKEPVEESGSQPDATQPGISESMASVPVQTPPPSSNRPLLIGIGVVVIAALVWYAFA
ncbi:CoxG family protein [Pusillimonas noertemannii]|uniref:CoxG family protein n=1 Tax=Pusillimonas noertemannii TaxID=305977 RepID=UPI003341F273